MPPHLASPQLHCLSSNWVGIGFIVPAEKTTAQDFRHVLEVNLLAPFLLAKAFSAMMLAQGSGSIVNVASTGPSNVPLASFWAMSRTKRD